MPHRRVCRFFRLSAPVASRSSGNPEKPRRLVGKCPLVSHFCLRDGSKSVLGRKSSFTNCPSASFLGTISRGTGGWRHACEFFHEVTVDECERVLKSSR